MNETTAAKSYLRSLKVLINSRLILNVYTWTAELLSGVIVTPDGAGGYNSNENCALFSLLVILISSVELLTGRNIGASTSTCCVSRYSLNVVL